MRKNTSVIKNRKIKGVGKRRKALSSLFQIRMLIVNALDFDNQTAYNTALLKLKILVEGMEEG